MRWSWWQPADTVPERGWIPTGKQMAQPILKRVSPRMAAANHPLVAFGANLPQNEHPPKETVRAALDALAEAGFAPIVTSSIYVTPCFPAGAGPDYVNAVAQINGASQRPEAILDVLHKIEARFGRTRENRWAGRTLDLDLIAMGDLVLPDAQTHRRWRELAPEDQARQAPDQLILPHPRLQDRAFVLVPLCDVAPDWRHPVLGLTARALLAALPAADVAAVKPL